MENKNKRNQNQKASSNNIYLNLKQKELNLLKTRIKWIEETKLK